jgi:CubicO group peptidase (beta-lactamase class C family)
MEDMTVTAKRYDFGAVHAVMRRYVDANIFAGLSSAVLVGRELADVHCVGWADKERDDKLRVDHIFRVFSNTKLITSCAAMLLFEEGRFQLDDPTCGYILGILCGNRCHGPPHRDSQRPTLRLFHPVTDP